MTSSWSSGRNASLFEMHILFCNAQIAKNLSSVEFRPCMEKDLTPRFCSHIFFTQPVVFEQLEMAGLALQVPHKSIWCMVKSSAEATLEFQLFATFRHAAPRRCLWDFVWLNLFNNRSIDINCMYNDSQRPILRGSSDGVRFGRWCDEWRCNV